MSTYNSWSHDFLDLIHAPHTTANARAMVAWCYTESGPNGAGRFNPLNSTEDAPGSTIFNSAGVRNYASLQSGLDATVRTIESSGHGYELILSRLRKSARPGRTCHAIDESDWGTSGLILRVLEDVKRDYWSRANIHVAGS